MRRIASLGILLALFTTAAFGQAGIEAGLVLEDYVITGGSAGDNPDYYLTNLTLAKLYFSVEGPIWSFSLQGGGSMTLGILELDNSSKVAIDEEKPTFRPDLSNLALSGNIPLGGTTFQSLGIQFGRFSMAESSRLVFSHTLDGLSATLLGNTLSLGLFAGYNGLLFRDSSTLSFTPSDEVDDANDKNILATPRLVTGLSTRVSPPGSVLSYTADFVYMADLRDLVSPNRTIDPGSSSAGTDEEGGLYSTFHMVNQIGFTPSSTLFFNLTGVFQTGQSLIFHETFENKTILAGAAAASMNLFPGSGHRVAVSGGWSSGDGSYRDQFNEGASFSEDKNFVHQFRGLSSAGLGTVFSPSLGNLVWGDVQWNAKLLASSPSDLLSSMQTTLRALTFFRGTEGPISDSSAVTEGTSPYLGTEVDLGLSFRPASDFGFGLSAGFFMPASFAGGAFEGAGNSLDYMITAFLSLRI